MGNLLPDWLSASGAGRLRERTTATVAATDSITADLLTGVRLHLATDARFHSHPFFKELTATATRLLREAPFSTLPPRLFFLGHVAVELSLDGRTLTRQPYLADDLYANIDICGIENIARTTRMLLDLPEPAEVTLTQYLHGFRNARYLTEYLRPEGQAEALHRVSRRAGLTGFPDPADRTVLTETLTFLSPLLADREEELLMPPALNT